MTRLLLTLSTPTQTIPPATDFKKAIGNEIVSTLDTTHVGRFLPRPLLTGLVSRVTAE